jgi:hypothetical protein
MKKIVTAFFVIVSCIHFSFALSKLDTAVSRMYESNLTIFDNSKDFMADKELRRDEAAKFFVKYAKEIQAAAENPSIQWCNNFTDLSEGWSDLTDIMKESCRLWLFKGHNNKFMPKDLITNWQAITVLIRIIDGMKDETWSHYAQRYRQKSQELWIINWIDVFDTDKRFDELATRWNIAILLYNAMQYNSLANKSTENEWNWDILPEVLDINNLIQEEIPKYNQNLCKDEITNIIKQVEVDYLRWREDFQKAKLEYLNSRNCYETQPVPVCDWELSQFNVNRQNKITKTIKEYKDSLVYCWGESVLFWDYSSTLSWY